MLNVTIHNNIAKTENLLNSINTADAIQFSKLTKEKANLRYNGLLVSYAKFKIFFLALLMHLNLSEIVFSLNYIYILSALSSIVFTANPILSRTFHSFS